VSFGPLRRFVTLSPGILYTTAALMASVAVACTVLGLVWSVPAWRRRLAPIRATSVASGLSGWLAGVGSGLVSAGITASALLAWYGVYCALAAL
jgi:hypothetical protein